MFRIFRSVTAAAVLAAAPVASQAASVDALEMLATFNSIALGDYQTSSHTEGPAYVGGDFISGATDVNGDGSPNGRVGDIEAALVVGGDVVGSNTKIQNGDVYLGGSGSVINNSGGTITYGSVPVADVTAAFQSLSAHLASYDTDTPGASADASDINQKKIVSGAGGSGLLSNFAVLNLDASFFDGGSLSQFSIDPGVTLLINASGTNVTLSGNFNAISDHVIVNFFEATTLALSNGNFGFSILAPLADISNVASGIYGTMVGKSITSSAEIRRGFNGELPPSSPPPVPLPAGLVLLLSGLGAFGVARARKAA
ncbi:choice-of-anchor A family protein [Sulfitobacter sp. LCG007]